MGWASVDVGNIEVVQEKTGKKVWIPIHRDLKAVLSSMPRRSVKILTNLDGVPWTKDGFRSQWAHQMDCIELESGACCGMVFHGLRKSAVCMLLESGCSDAMVSAITGQSRQMVEHYSHEINQHKLAATAILAWENANWLETVDAISYASREHPRWLYALYRPEIRESGKAQCGF
jgi:integrase